MELSNYAKKADLKRATDYYTSTLASKTDLASLKTKIDDLALDKLKTVPADLSNLSNVENDGVKKKCLINWLPKSVLLILRCQGLVY